jgi:hypothetical protein
VSAVHRAAATHADRNRGARGVSDAHTVADAYTVTNAVTIVDADAGSGSDIGLRGERSIVAFDVALFGWHATIFLGGWVLLLGGLALAAIVALISRF